MNLENMFHWKLNDPSSSSSANGQLLPSWIHDEVLSHKEGAPNSSTLIMMRTMLEEEWLMAGTDTSETMTESIGNGELGSVGCRQQFEALPGLSLSAMQGSSTHTQPLLPLPCSPPSLKILDNAGEGFASFSSMLLHNGSHSREEGTFATSNVAMALNMAGESSGGIQGSRLVMTADRFLSSSAMDNSRDIHSLNLNMGNFAPNYNSSVESHHHPLSLAALTGGSGIWNNQGRLSGGLYGGSNKGESNSNSLFPNNFQAMMPLNHTLHSSLLPPLESTPNPTPIPGPLPLTLFQKKAAHRYASSTLGPPPVTLPTAKSCLPVDEEEEGGQSFTALLLPEDASPCSKNIDGNPLSEEREREQRKDCNEEREMDEEASLLGMFKDGKDGNGDGMDESIDGSGVLHESEQVVGVVGVGGGGSIPDRGKGRKGGPPAKNLMAERRRRKKLNDRLFMLRSVVPKISKMDKASILGDAIDYLRELLQRINELTNELEATPDRALAENPPLLHPLVLGSANIPNSIKEESSPNVVDTQPIKVDVQTREGRGLNIHMFCARKPGLLLSTMRALDSLGLDVQQAVISCFNGFALDVFRAEQLQEVPAEEIKKMLIMTASSPSC